jgi:CheY-like chemotaxis protein
MANRILIVEDEVVISMEIEVVLQQLGYEVAGSAMTGKDAILRAAETRPDLVLMDIWLKGEMDGTVAAEQINRLYKIPVIFLTAYSDSRTLEKAIATRPFGYLIKPFRKNELHTSIEIALQNHRALLAEQELTKKHVRAGVVDHITGDDIFTKTLAIDDYLERVSKDISPAAPGQEYLEKIRELVHEIQNSTRSGRGDSRPGLMSPEWHNVQLMVAAAADATLPSQVKVENEAGTIEIYADPLFSRVFSNLFKNSCRNGRTVDRIRITFQARDDQGLLIIEDNGAGIPEAAKEDLSSPAIPGGNDNGLFLVQEILQISGMVMNETGMPGAGARFEITIPHGQYREKPEVV